MKAALPLIALGLTIGGTSACANEPPQDTQSDDQRKARWQEYAENYGEIDLTRFITDIFNSILGYSGDCEIHLIHRRTCASMTLRFVRDDREVLALSVRMNSVFRDSGDVLYVAHYIDSREQRSVAVYDLKTGKTLWRTALTNQYFTSFGDDGQFTVQLRKDVVIVVGKENNGSYVEIFDQKTGEQLAYHARPPVRKDSRKQPTKQP
jgi:hypothetical protein